ncbi:hypothetical protein BTHERMOSOX_247 [Bathymodiolus thermophilus thioautotrophic gill symbiont]|jgi:hypothetical protein|uniref:Uncharacterized protein n=1 Tax=Bathymodiolus thermophilus thioautotrophic gill symbiont TaxID=2360 RepID=A0A3G3IQ40_9GAMM|nr:hypothetical protein [Bathymodiolus thermophilus thioautotrophic gill symbiont]AYQ57592.1 hypothetical protein MS2017_1929 [Bathymodiolus thermophilus thioautotrophic gill symbiont]CAB5496400.1 hypothetical protein THERMOT_512 [Bathymodiolus thermophilus thioautotrophic gill symbiont]CAB5500499.1 hypothetical protein THERMOS_1220 [Bathymodiolus thermophilus thioautotrophic gill symbiont]SHA12530.1 hypothetical protein BTHERMOSOX_247 [Bathymodiolus thermophilus thioautotrophic gill symbiont]
MLQATRDIRKSVDFFQTDRVINIIEGNLPYRYFINKRDELKQDADACIYETCA